jgi:ABC-type phosphate transport system permease subunit
MGLVTIAASLLTIWIGLVLLVRAWPMLSVKPLGELLFSTTWKPLQNAFGYFPFIMGDSGRYGDRGAHLLAGGHLPG